MRILLDHGVPAPLREFLRDHTVATAYEMGWARLDNGALLISVEGAFDALITTDKTSATSRISLDDGLPSSFSQPQVGRESKPTLRRSLMRSAGCVPASCGN